MLPNSTFAKALKLSTGLFVLIFLISPPYILSLPFRIVWLPITHLTGTPSITVAMATTGQSSGQS